MMGVTGRLVPGGRVGDYVLGRELPSRSTELVFTAAHVRLPRLARFVAASSTDNEAVVPLLRQACILETVRHPAVPRIYECGLLPDRRPWLALEITRGPTVGALLAERPFAVAEVIDLLRECSALLEHAHARNVVHHGLQPGVITRGEAGLRVTDWSTAWIATESGSEMIDDLRALGAVAYQALTRSPPTIPAARRCPGAPARLTSLIDRMLGATPVAGPSASDVRAEAAQLTGRLARSVELDDGTPIEEVEVVLVDISRDPPPIPRQTKVRSSPAWAGYQARMSNAVHAGKKTP
jgi:serine/threonine protein kinase